MFEKCSETDVVCTFLLQNVVFATSSCNFVDIRTPKSDSERKCFVHFHFQMCFSPQRRAIFRHQNFKKCSDTVCFLAFSLPNVLFATAACNFWFLLWAPTSAPAALTGLLLDWPDTRIIEKTQHFATSLTFGADVSSFFWLSRYCIFFLLTWLLYSAFQLSILSEVCYLNFLRRILLLRWIKQLHNQSTLFWWWGHSMPARHQAYSAACWSSISQTRSKIATTRAICPSVMDYLDGRLWNFIMTKLSFRRVCWTGVLLRWFGTYFFRQVFFPLKSWAYNLQKPYISSLYHLYPGVRHQHLGMKTSYIFLD